MTSRAQSQCAPSCARFRSPFSPDNVTGKIECDAFPEGIPDAIWRNQLDHRLPIDGDHGVRRTSNGQEFPTYAISPDRIGVGKP